MACLGCLALDGTGPAQGALVAELRTLGGAATPDALRGELGWSTDELQSALRGLKRRGRVVVRHPEEAGWGEQVEYVLTVQEVA